MPFDFKSNPLKTHPRLTAALTAAAIVLGGLGAFSLLPRDREGGVPVQQVVAQANLKSPPPRMLETGAPFSFADLVERVSPAVVTVTAEEQESVADQQGSLDDLPAPFR